MNDQRHYPQHPQFQTNHNEQEQHFRQHFQPQQSQRQQGPQSPQQPPQPPQPPPAPFTMEQRDKWRALVLRLTKDEFMADSLTLGNARWLESKKFTEAEMSAALSVDESWSEIELRLMDNRRKAKRAMRPPPDSYRG